ncbi:MAG: acyl-CoA dehydratase activase [Clostridiales bacterium]|nr:acyl-CoA dehydratase activase [Clostridiales bacterium]
MFLGVDIGSSSSKAVLINPLGEIVGQKAIQMGTGTVGAKSVEQALLEETGVKRSDVLFAVVTGYGRMTYPGCDLQITEISCHAAGVCFSLPGTRTIVDIGGQDAKVIRVDQAGRVVNFGMNEKCAAGTGRFLEVMARVLGCRIGELSALAGKSQNTVKISSVCTVFAESEVISQLAAGAKIEDVAKGAHNSVATRVAGMCNRIGVEEAVAMTGGVALNQDMVKSMAAALSVPICVPESPQTIGALGAAHFAREKYGRL